MDSNEIYTKEKGEPLWKVITGGIMLFIIMWIIAVGIMLFFPEPQDPMSNDTGEGVEINL